MLLLHISQILRTFAVSMDLRIDIDAVLRQRLPQQYRWIPAPLVRWLKAYVCQDRMNQILEVTDYCRDSEFARAVLRELQVTCDAPEAKVAGHAVTYVSNHPLGGLDGMCLIDWVARRHGVEPYFVVNDLLMVLSPLHGVFVPVNKHGAQSRGAAADVDKAFADVSRPMIMFPAGLCSRQSSKDAEVRDLKWNKMFVQKSALSGRTVIPVHFIGENSPAFYRLARRRQRLGIKFNIEMARLPREMVEAQGKSFTIKVGAPIAPQNLCRGGDAVRQAAEIREYIYTL